MVKEISTTTRVLNLLFSSITGNSFCRRLLLHHLNTCYNYIKYYISFLHDKRYLYVFSWQHNFYLNFILYMLPLKVDRLKCLLLVALLEYRYV